MFEYLTGIYNITPTPFKADGSLDEPSLRKLTEFTRGTAVNGMTILDMSYSAQNVVKGIVLLIAILIDSFLNPRNEETAQQGDI